MHGICREMEECASSGEEEDNEQDGSMGGGGAEPPPYAELFHPFAPLES